MPALLATLPLTAQVSVLAYQCELTRAGANRGEIGLTAAYVNSGQFEKRFSYPVDGYVYAQPLYLPNGPQPAGSQYIHRVCDRPRMSKPANRHWSAGQK